MKTLQRALQLPNAFAEIAVEVRVADSGKTIALLIDFDNAFMYEDRVSLDWLDRALKDILLRVLEIEPLANTINVRLYGGWLEGELLTALGSKVEQVINRHPQFFPFTLPKTSDIIRGTVELAVSMLSQPTLNWIGTKRERAGLPRLRLVESPNPSGCATPASCILVQMKRIAKNRKSVCPTAGCSVRTRSAFQIVEQKMVDTMIACDAIECALKGTYDHIMLLSDDIDIFPPAAMAKSLTTSAVSLIHRSNQLPAQFALLETAGVIAHHLHLEV